MFHDISADMHKVMRAMEEQLECDQPSLQSVPGDVGRLLSLLAMTAPEGAFLELGSSGGYSSMWLSLAARARGVKLTTVDYDEKKVALARQNLSSAGAGDLVQVFHGDAFDYATRFDKLAFCFSDLHPPEHNGKIYELVVPRLVPGGWLVIDNINSPRYQTEIVNRAESDPRIDCVLLPFLKGDLICRKC